jgi:spore coat protein U-like protein
MKKFFLLTFLALPVLASAQGDNEASVNVSTTIQTAITVTNAADLSFGTIASFDANASVPSDTTASFSDNVGNTAARGKVDITGENSGAIIINITGASLVGNVLTLDNGDVEELDVTLNYRFTKTGSSTAYTNGANATLSAAGAASLFIGGTILAADLDAAAADSYDADITVTVIYQ